MTAPTGVHTTPITITATTVAIIPTYKASTLRTYTVVH